MAGLGETLRRERLLRQVTLAEIASATRIGVHFLEALEEDRFQDLPGGIFSRSFVRAYVRYLGLDENEIVQQFVRLAGAPELPLPAPPAGRRRPAAFTGNHLLALLLLIIAAGTGWAGVRLWRQHRASRSAAAPAVPTPRPVAVAAAPAPQPPLGSGPLEFSVAARDESAWIAVTADGQELLETTLNPGDTRLFHAHASFEVLTGNAGATAVAVNGAPVPALGKPGAVVRFHYPPSPAAPDGGDPHLP